MSNLKILKINITDNHPRKPKRTRRFQSKGFFLKRENYGIMTTTKKFFSISLVLLAVNAIRNCEKVLFLLSEYHQVVIRVSFISWDFPPARQPSQRRAYVLISSASPTAWKLCQLLCLMLNNMVNHCMEKVNPSLVVAAKENWKSLMRLIGRIICNHYLITFSFVWWLFLLITNIVIIMRKTINHHRSRASCKLKCFRNEQLKARVHRDERMQ